MINAKMLKGKMVAAEMTQQTLAKAAGMSRSSMNAKINGYYPFNVDEVVLICDILGIVDAKEKENIFLQKQSQ